MKRYQVTFLIFALVALVYPHLFSSGAVANQKRRARRVPGPQTTSKPGIDYSRFSHFTKKHQAECNTCHKVPTDNWKKVRDFPDVADYPGHEACVGCHRPQFFKGPKPVICSICHSKVSPRDDARFAFRNPASPRQFLIEFPHDKHQDVIARLDWPTVKQTAATPRGLPAGGPRFSLRRAWAHSRFVPAPPSQTNSLLYNIHPADDKTKRYNNCEICHGPRTTAQVGPATGWVDSFVPDAAAFKAAPTSHAACFNCHWKSQPPTGGNCAGCHKLSDKAAFTVDTPVRLSLKFRHAREQHTAECTTCHINITKSNTLRGLKADVPITSCTECHNKEGLRLDVSKELEALDKNRDFVCSYCHTSDIGRRDPPASHYLIAGREPLLRKDIK
jgi:hypothetical protein